MAHRLLNALPDRPEAAPDFHDPASHRLQVIGSTPREVGEVCPRRGGRFSKPLQLASKPAHHFHGLWHGAGVHHSLRDGFGTGHRPGLCQELHVPGKTCRARFCIPGGRRFQLQVRLLKPGHLALLLLLGSDRFLGCFSQAQVLAIPFKPPHLFV